jgi:subtilisin family serine protease
MQYSRSLSELPVGSGDPLWPLRFIDARFEPHDPVFDVEDEPVRPRRRKRAPAAAAAAIAATIACGGSDRPSIRATDSILVQLQEGASPPPHTGGADSGPPIVALRSFSPDGDGSVLRLELPPGTDPFVAAEQAARAPGVAFAEPVYIYRLSKTPNDPRFKDLWGLANIDAPSAWDRSTGERSVTVAVIDDGIALDHPDLIPNLWVNPQEIACDGRDADGNGIVGDVHGANFYGEISGDPSPSPSGDTRWHGTHVAGTIGAAGDNRIGVAGVNWKVSVMALRALGPQGGRSDDLARAIDYAADHGARIINASWGGGGKSEVLAKAIARAGKKGVLFVAAAGNDAAASPDFPADLKLANILSVGATTPDDLLAPFSNRGALIGAPGVGILSTTAPGRYERYDGTSMASAHVAGVAALLWAAHPKASLKQVRDAILASGLQVDNVQHGRIDAMHALAALDAETGDAGEGLVLSREELKFAVKKGRVPRAQTVSLRSDGGGKRAWTAAPDAKWIVLKKPKGETPSRISVRVDPAKLGNQREGHIEFRDDAGDKVSLKVAVQSGSAVAASGEGCEMRGGALHVRAGSGCALAAAEADAPDVKWVLPGGTQASGSRLYAHFVRRGQFQVLVSSDEGEAEPLPVVIE